MKKRIFQLPEVHFSDDGPIRHLHLGTEWIQGSMYRNHPTRLVHDYIKRMMAWLLFVAPDSVKNRTSIQLGLGAGSLTKFCTKELSMKTTAIEINAQVVTACRGWFKLPPDNENLQIVLADAAQEIQNPTWWNTADALQVDLYDHQAAAPVLDSLSFYNQCRRLLTPEGCMTVNLFGRSSSYSRSLDKISAAFGHQAVWAFKPTREGNTVILAQRTPLHIDSEVLMARAHAIESMWKLPATQWVRMILDSSVERAQTCRLKVEPEFETKCGCSKCGA